MYKSTEIYNVAKKYVTTEIAKYDRLIMKNSQLIIRYEAQVKKYETLDAPNIKGLIQYKIKAIENCERKILRYRNEIGILNLIPLKRVRVFNYILKTLNFNISREVLKGGIYNFPLNIGKLYILVGDRKFTLNSINWARSMQILNNIAKRDAPSIYAQYKKREIQQFEYVQLMREHVYPTYGKPRWIVYCEDDTSWWIIFKRGAYKNANKYYFKFKGTYFVIFKNKSIASLKKVFGTVNEVLDCKKIGFVNKVLILKTYFNEQKYYYNDISTNKW